MKKATMTTMTQTPERAGVDPFSQNPIRVAVADIRALQAASMTPRQREIQARGRARVDALIASGHYSLA